MLCKVLLPSIEPIQSSIPPTLDLKFMCDSMKLVNFSDEREMLKLFPEGFRVSGSFETALEKGIEV